VLVVLCFASLSFAQHDACSSLRIPTYLSNAGFGWVRDIVWASEDMQDVYVRADGNLIFRSTNGGDIFFPIMDDIPDFYTEFGQHNFGVITMKSGAADGLVYFLGATRKNYWVTTGDGVYTEILAGDDFFTRITPHPTYPNLVLRLVIKCREDESCYSQLELSENYGAADSFRVVRQYVYGFSWGNSENEIFMISVPENEMQGDHEDVEKSIMRFYTTRDLGRSFPYVSDPGVYAFELDDGIVYIIQYNEQLDRSELLLSNNSGESFLPASYNGVSSISSIDSAIYEVLDSSEGVSFLCVCSTGRYQTLATLFQADLDDALFWLNLQSIRATCNPWNWHGIDFQQIPSLSGTYFANTFGQEAFFSVDNDIEEYIQSVISFDKGGTWTQLPPPEGSHCNGNEACHLHLFSNANTNTPTDVQSIYSTHDAVGILIATGNVGEYRKSINESDTYISRNGGYSWELLREGIYTYCMASHGSLLIMVPLNLTNTMYYSWDQGLSWDSCFFTHDLVKVNSILDISNGGKDPSLRFMFVGIADNGGFMMTASFTQTQPPECQGFNQPGSSHSDFELFIPEEGYCLLGEQVAYTRRKRDALCVTRYQETATTISSCSCTREDYTCAGGCWEESIDKQGQTVCINSCAGQPNDPTLPPANCHGTYQVPSGYRLVEGDKCIGGLQLSQPETRACP